MFGFGKKNSAPFVSAVLLATSGQWDATAQQELYQLPLVVRTITAFEECRRIHEIVLVCKQEEIAEYYYIIQEYDLDKVVSVVGAGQNRQESVFNGVMACSEHTRLFAIHDEARPLVDPSDIENCIDVAMLHGAAALGVQVKDTVKICDTQGVIVATPDRAGLVTMQAPRVFDAARYRTAMEKTLRENKVYHDDCQMLERDGVMTHLSPGSYHNIRISTQEDLALATAILQFQEEGADLWQASV